MSKSYTHNQVAYNVATSVSKAWEQPRLPMRNDDVRFGNGNKGFGNG